MSNNITDFNRIDSSSNGGWVLSIVPSSNPPLGESPKRKSSITKKQFNDHIGCLTDITSKMDKPIHKQNALSALMFWLLNESIRKSDSGKNTFTINQLALLDVVLPATGKKITKQRLTNAIKNMTHHKMIESVSSYQVGVRATNYILLPKITDLLEIAEKDRLDDRDRKINPCQTDTRIRYDLAGYCADDKKVCKECDRVLFLTKFGIYCDHHLYDVCYDCYHLNQFKNNRIKNHNTK